MQIGDRVLSQDPETGELAYKVVFTTTLRPPHAMLEIKAGDDKIITTSGHVFWVAGQGWRMAKELKRGERLHAVRHAVPIDHIEPAAKVRHTT